ncbi:RING/FYVE/PHD zinc finger superfamily protein [Raphanus sativus]|nr:RING/FYVE/PHD zinc finger superfamily protein [Raphanus sativus]
METGNKEAVQTEATDMKNEDVDICRICQSPEEEPDNPLRHPCACRGSLKYVHTDCIFLWINRRSRRKHCEICKRSYSIIPVYSDNAPERLSSEELLKSVLLRAFRFMALILPWLLAIAFHSHCMLFLLADMETEFENKRVFELSCFFLGLLYTVEIVTEITFIVVLRVIYEEIARTEPELLNHVHLIANGLRHKGATRVLLVLWKYMRILCDWWHDQLLRLSFFHDMFMRGPLALAFVPRNTQLDEFGSIRRFLFFLDDNTFAVLAINISWSFLDYLLPYLIGKAVFVLLLCLPPHGWILENISEITVGHIVLLSVWLAYLKSVFFTLIRNPTRTRWFLLSVKNALILCFKTILLPWMLGCWIDFCTFPLTGATLSQRLEVVSDYPLMAAKHWCVGIGYLLAALSCMKLIQEIVQKRAFWYLLDVTEPNYKTTKLHLRSLLFAFAFHGASDTTDEEEDTNEQSDERFVLRIGMMLVLAALSMFLVSTTVMALPVLAGRAFFHSISFYMLSFGLEHDDICAFWIGLCIMRKIYKITCFVYDHVVTRRIDLLFNHVLKCIQNVLLFSIRIFVVPGLLGLLIDLMIIIPSQVSLDELPVYNFLHDWLIGVCVLHILIFLTMSTPVTCFATVAWCEKLQIIRSVGINHLPFTWLIQDVIGSAINTLLTTLCVPYVLVNNSLFPVLGFSRETNLTVQRFVWPVLLAVMVIWFSAKLTRDLIIYIHQVEFDNRYKVGERLVDFTEDL